MATIHLELVCADGDGTGITSGVTLADFARFLRTCEAFTGDGHWVEIRAGAAALPIKRPKKQAEAA